VADDSAISAKRLLELIEAKAAPVVLDVRSHREYRTGHVPGAINVPFWTIPTASIPAMGPDRVIVYCGHGPRAVAARSLLRWRGFRRVVLLAGHMSAWRAGGHEEET
jgi:rhodanese-related sulfurtransferase